MDVELARLFERLAADGRDSDTLVLLLSDHGTEFYEHGGMWHGHSLYGELTDVPLVALWPGAIAAGRTIDEVVQTIDVAPTLLELAGLPVPKPVQGQSLAPFLGAGAAPDAAGEWPGWRRRPAVSEHVPTEAAAKPPKDLVADAIVGPQWKLIRNRAGGRAEFELFDWKSDPLNQRDLAKQHADVVAKLAGELAAWRKRVEAEKLPADAALSASMSAEELEQLRSLGYL
jgi:arylsulfatase A-like enzyme